MRAPLVFDALPRLLVTSKLTQRHCSGFSGASGVSLSPTASLNARSGAMQWSFSFLTAEGGGDSRVRSGLTPSRAPGTQSTPKMSTLCQVSVGPTSPRSPNGPELSCTAPWQCSTPRHGTLIKQCEGCGELRKPPGPQGDHQ